MSHGFSQLQVHVQLFCDVGRGAQHLVALCLAAAAEGVNRGRLPSILPFVRGAFLLVTALVAVGVQAVVVASTASPTRCEKMPGSAALSVSAGSRVTTTDVPLASTLQTIADAVRLREKALPLGAASPLLFPADGGGFGGGAGEEKDAVDKAVDTALQVRELQLL